LFTIAAVCSPTLATAQIDNRFAAGVSVTTRVGSSTANGSSDIGFEVRLGHEREQWGWAYSFFSWFDTDLKREPTAATANLGTLRVRPVLLGYGYTWVHGRTSITADLLGGVAFNSFDLDSAARTDYLQRGAANVDTEATNTFAVKPEVQVWYDYSARIGIRITGGYLVSRPSISVISSFGRETLPVRADTILITAGVVYSIF